MVSCGSEIWTDGLGGMIKVMGAATKEKESGLHMR